MAAPTKKPRRAPTLNQTATAPQAVNRGAREGTTQPEPAEVKRGVGRPKSTTGGKPLHFSVDPEFALDYKTFAAANGLTMRELLENSFAEYKRNHS